MAFWLLKSEPAKYSWDALVRDGRTPWDGVRSPEATNNLKAMKAGDRAFFYHSNEGREIVGTIAIVRPFYLDPKDESGRFGMVDVAPLVAATEPVPLSAIKAVPELAQMALVRQSRLSVSPVREAEWSLLCGMAGIAP